MIIDAYNEFKESAPAHACQRDFLYYGMSKENQNHGVLNSSIRECIYRFKLNPMVYGRISDDLRGDVDSEERASGDPALHRDFHVRGRSNDWTKEELENAIWYRGAYEFIIQVSIPKLSGAIKEATPYILTVQPRDVFSLTKIERKFKKQTALERGVYYYYFKPDNLVAKWIYPTNDWELDSWDISSDSPTIFFHCSEYDPSISEKRTTTYSLKNISTNKFTSSLSSGELVKTSFGITVENSTVEDISVKTETINYHDSDTLGVCSLFYEKGIIKKPATQIVNGVTENGYIVNPISGGDITITLLPKDIR